MILAQLAEWMLRAAEQAPQTAPSMPATLFDYGIRAAGAIGLPAAVTWFFVDRRRTKAAATVDERSITANVAKNDASAFEAYVLAVEKAIGAERASKDRQIVNMEHELADLATRHALRMQELVADSLAKDLLIADLQSRIATLTGEARARARDNDGEGVA